MKRNKTQKVTLEKFAKDKVDNAQLKFVKGGDSVGYTFYGRYACSC